MVARPHVPVVAQGRFVSAVGEAAVSRSAHASPAGDLSVQRGQRRPCGTRAPEDARCLLTGWLSRVAGGRGPTLPSIPPSQGGMDAQGRCWRLAVPEEGFQSRLCALRPSELVTLAQACAGCQGTCAHLGAHLTLIRLFFHFAIKSQLSSLLCKKQVSKAKALLQHQRAVTRGHETEQVSACRGAGGRASSPTARSGTGALGTGLGDSGSGHGSWGQELRTSPDSRVGTAPSPHP